MKFMANISKKILQEGYTTKSKSFPRGHFNNEMEESETGIQHSKTKKGSDKWCAKTKSEHTLVIVPPTGNFGFESTKAEYMANLFRPKKSGNLFAHGATVSVCTTCGKIIVKWNK